MTEALDTVKARTKTGHGHYLGLGVKLTILLVGAFVFLIVITSVFSIKQLRSSLSLGMQEMADGLGKVVGLASAYQGFFDVDNRKLNQYVESAASLRDIEYAAILDRSGRIITARGLNRDERQALETGELPVPSEEVYQTREDIVLDAPIGKLGTIVIGLSKMRLNAAENRIIGTQLKVAGLVFFFTLIVLWLVVFSITRPLSILAEQTKKIGEGNLSEPIYSQASDEVGMLARSIDEMRINIYRNIEKIGFLGHVAHELNTASGIAEAVEILKARIEHYPLWPWHLVGLALVGRNIPDKFFRYIPMLPPGDEEKFYPVGATVGVCLRDEIMATGDTRTVSAETDFGRFIVARKMTTDLAIPLTVRGTLLGAVYAGFQDETARSPEFQGILQNIADDLSSTIDNIYLVEDLKFNLDQLKRAHQELKSLDDLKTEFISGVSHELRSPLMAISGYVQMMLDSKLGVLTDLQREGLEVCSKSLQRLTALIEQMLSFSSTHAHDELAFSLVDIGRVIDHCVKMEQGRARQRDIEIRVGVEPSLPPVRIDEDRIIQVFINLLDNAVKFSPDGSSIEIKARKPFQESPEKLHRIEILIRDHGRGIPPEDLDRIFDKFYQSARGVGQRFSGIGLGLSLVKKIIDQHGCDIHVESRLGSGSTFIFTLPTAEP